MRKLLVLCILVLFVGCAKSPTGRNQLMLISPEQAIRSSSEAYVQTLQPLQRQGKVDNDIHATRRVREITGKIIYQAIIMFPESKNWDWSVKVIDDPKTVNAWCMAGGKMAIYTGLLDKVKPTDDELAQVMGHEISHALSNHTAERMSVAMASQIGLLGVAIATSDSGHRGLAMSGAAMAAALAINLPNSRASETEADVLGMELAAKAGYNPNAAATLWQKMGQVGGSSPPQWLSTHPSPVNRQENLRQLAGEMMPYYLADTPRPVYPLR